MAYNADDDDEANGKHPALKNFSRFGFQVKHILGRVLKWGAIGALALGALSAVAATSFAVSSPVGWIATGISTLVGWFTGKGLFGGPAAALGSIASQGLLSGGIGGALIGLATGLSDAGEAADAEEDRLISRYEQAQARAARQEKLREARDRRRIEMERDPLPTEPLARFPARPRLQHAQQAYA